MEYRRSPRINITLPTYVIALMRQHQKHNGWTCSQIIQIALREWFAKHQQTLQTSTAQVRQYDTQNKTYRDYIDPSMSGEKMLEILFEYEAAVGKALMEQ